MRDLHDGEIIDDESLDDSVPSPTVKDMIGDGESRCDTCGHMVPNQDLVAGIDSPGEAGQWVINFCQDYEACQKRYNDAQLS